MTTVTLPREVVRKALSRSHSLGQTYWQQADSESYRQNAKADKTDATFKQLIIDTCAALDAPQVTKAKPRACVCECCKGTGTIDERLGGYADSNPAATCPDCDGDGAYVIGFVDAPANPPCQMCMNSFTNSRSALVCGIAVHCTDFDQFQALPPISLTKVTK